jgi:hypothetical protein
MCFILLYLALLQLIKLNTFKINDGWKLLLNIRQDHLSIYRTDE